MVAKKKQKTRKSSAVQKRAMRQRQQRERRFWLGRGMSPKEVTEMLKWERKHPED